VEVGQFKEKLNKIDGNVYVIEEVVQVTNGVYEGELLHDNVNVSTLSVYTGPKLTGDRIQNYALLTPSTTPWKRIIRLYADVPRVYISYETDGDTVEAEDVNRLQESTILTQKALNDEVIRAETVEASLANDILNETVRAESAERVLSDNLAAETSRAEVAEKKLTDDLFAEITRSTGAEATLTENLSAEAARATEAEQKLTTDLSAEVTRSKAAEKTLTDNLSAEVTRAKTSEKTLTDDLSAEISRATGAEKVLTDDLAAETTRAIGVEKTLTSNLNAEVTRAKAAEKTNADNLTTESDRATAKEAELQGSIQTETTRAQAAEKTLTDHLSAEVTRAKAAEKTNADNLTAEVTRSKGAEKTLTDNLAAEVTRAKAAEKTNSDSVSAEVTRAKAKEAELQGNITAEVSRATAAENDIRSTISTNKPNWDDKYTKNEVDNKFSALETAIDWKEAVNTFADLAATYPNPEDGWTVNVKDTDYTYRWSGTAWIAISANAIPKATQSVDGLLSKEDKAALDDTNAKKHTHSNKSTLDKLTETLLSNWTDAYNKRHEHGNKTVIDKITQTLLDNWTAAYAHISDAVKHITATERANWNDANDKKHTHANKSIIDKLTQAMVDKLAGIAAGAEVNVQADWNVVDDNSDAYIKNKPSAMPASDVLAWAKAANKPAYSWEEIGGKPSAFLPSSHTHNLLSVQSDNYKQGTDLPSTYPQGETIFFSNLPTAKFNGNNYCTVHTIKGYKNMACIQFLYPYNGDTDKVYYRMGLYNSDTWRAWKEISVFGHTHTKSQITDFPSSMPASDVAAWAKATTKPSYGWTEITGKPSTFAPSAHTHTKSQITDMPTKLSQFTNDPGFITQADVDTSQSHTHSNKAILDKITQAMLDTWNGISSHISNKSNPHGVTAAQAGAAPSSHTHTKAQITDFPASLPANGGTANYANYLNVNNIAANTDLNTITTPGYYYCPMSATVTTFKNSPTTMAFFMEVGKHAGVYQRIVEYTVSNPKTYERNYYSDSWGTWKNITVLTPVPAGAKFTDTVYAHPATAGNKHIPAGGAFGQFLKWSADGTAIWAADNNTTYSAFKAATASAAGGAGLVPAPPAGAQAKYLRADGTWQTPPNTTYSDMKGATASAAGTHGLVPAPAAGAQTKFLRADGSWQTPPDTKYSHPNSGVVAGDYQSVTVNSQGHVTGGVPKGAFTWAQLKGAYTWGQLKGGS
jgi:hypothetical protein